MRNTCKKRDTETDVPVCRPVCYRHDLLRDMADGRLADTNTECYSYELFDIQLYSTSGRTFHNRRSVGHRNNSENTLSPILDEIQMQEICKRVTEYLETSQAFLGTTSHWQCFPKKPVSRKDAFTCRQQLYEMQLL